MHGHGMAQSVHRSRLDASVVGVIVEQLLDLALLQRSLAAGEEVRPDVSALPQIAAQQFGRMPPQRLLAAKPVFQSPDGDPMIFEVHIVDREHQCFADTQAVVIDQAKERLIAGRVDRREEAFQFVLRKVFRKMRHRSGVA
jgi:hypothetical protein